MKVSEANNSFLDIGILDILEFIPQVERINLNYQINNEDHSIVMPFNGFVIVSFLIEPKENDWPFQIPVYSDSKNLKRFFTIGKRTTTDSKKVYSLLTYLPKNEKLHVLVEPTKLKDIRFEVFRYEFDKPFYKKTTQIKYNFTEEKLYQTNIVIMAPNKIDLGCFEYITLGKCFFIPTGDFDIARPAPFIDIERRYFQIEIKENNLILDTNVKDWHKATTFVTLFHGESNAF